ncbi:hypothetical protein ACFL56_00480 [Candidatus Margulisiibacteriota bacterium]
MLNKIIIYSKTNYGKILFHIDQENHDQEVNNTIKNQQFMRYIYLLNISLHDKQWFSFTTHFYRSLECLKKNTFEYSKEYSQTIHDFLSNPDRVERLIDKEINKFIEKYDYNKNNKNILLKIYETEIPKLQKKIESFLAKNMDISNAYNDIVLFKTGTFKQEFNEEKISSREKNILQELLLKHDIFNTMFTEFFKRPTLTKNDISKVHIEYFNEGAFKRVYNVTVTLHNTFNFSFLIKIVKENVTASDTGHVYNINYVEKYISIAKKIREHNQFLHLPVGEPHTIYETKYRKERLVYTEALLPQIVDDPDPTTKGRITVYTYLMYWKAFNRRLYFDDPKYENVVIQKIGNRYKSTVIDLDNIDFDRYISPYEQVKAFILHGFSTEEIVLGVYDALELKNAYEYLNNAAFMLRQLSRKEYAEDLIDFFYILKDSEERYLLHPRSEKMIKISVNGIYINVSEDTNLLEVLQDSFVNINKTGIEINGRKIDTEPRKALQYKIENTILSEGDKIVFYDLFNY